MIRMIWTEFSHTKFGEEYLCLFIARQKNIRRWYKIITLLLSGGGIAFILKDLNLPSAILMGLSAIAQLLGLIENQIIPSEKNIEDLSTLRIMYWNQANKLEELYHSRYLDEIADDEAKRRFFQLRENAADIERQDCKIEMKTIDSLMKKAEDKVINYLNTYYDVKSNTTTDTTSTTAEEK